MVVVRFLESVHNFCLNYSISECKEFKSIDISETDSDFFKFCFES